MRLETRFCIQCCIGYLPHDTKSILYKENLETLTLFLMSMITKILDFGRKEFFISCLYYFPTRLHQVLVVLLEIKGDMFTVFLYLHRPFFRWGTLRCPPSHLYFQPCLCYSYKLDFCRVITAYVPGEIDHQWTLTPDTRVQLVSSSGHCWWIILMRQVPFVCMSTCHVTCTSCFSCFLVYDISLPPYITFDWAVSVLSFVHFIFFEPVLL